jgi:diguanylate cyclase (GGDEF)-like protein
MIDALKTLAMTDLIKIIGLAAILFAIVYRKIARHLHQLAEDVTQLAHSADAPKISIARKKVGSYHDELDVLVDAINGFVTDRRDEIRRRSAAEDSLRERVSEIEATLGALSDGVVALDGQCRIRYANDAACTLLQTSPETINEKRIDRVLRVINAATGNDFPDLFESVIASGEPIQLRRDVLVRINAGYEFDARISAAPVPGSGEVAMIFVFTDISEEACKQRKIEFQAFHDPLTRLGNRSLLARDLAKEIEQAQQDSSKFAVLCLDLDNFKNINDTLGHMLGDIMLKQLAGRFISTVITPGWVTRHGGDEFIVVLPQLASIEPATRLAEELMAAIAEPFYIEGHALRVTSSIGISLYPDHGTEIGKLISNADLAMYAAKRYGKNAFRIFEEDLLHRSTVRLSMENDLRVALNEEQFSLVFQPKVCLTTRRVDSVEALLRWNNPHSGLIPPDTFIPVAEDTGLIIDIGAWVLRESLTAACRLRCEVGYNVAVAINVSPVQFRSEALISTLRQLSEQTPDLPKLIEIELTETALSGNLDEIVGKLKAFKDLGLKIAIDDFGTGYSSLAYLKNFPIDILKIDQAFIRGLSNSTQDKAIVTTVVQLGKSLGFKTVAEGVEEEEHAKILSRLGCDYAQGYWFARPVPERELAEKIRAISGVL